MIFFYFQQIALLTKWANNNNCAPCKISNTIQCWSSEIAHHSGSIKLNMININGSVCILLRMRLYRKHAMANNVALSVNSNFLFQNEYTLHALYNKTKTHTQPSTNSSFICHEFRFAFNWKFIITVQILEPGIWHRTFGIRLGIQFIHYNCIYQNDTFFNWKLTLLIFRNDISLSENFEAILRFHNNSY